MTQADVALPMPLSMQAALVSQGLLPAVAQSLTQDLGWLAEITEQHKPFATTVHCLCTAP